MIDAIAGTQPPRLLDGICAARYGIPADPFRAQRAADFDAGVISIEARQKILRRCVRSLERGPRSTHHRI
jgi:hypothetical protein